MNPCIIYASNEPGSATNGTPFNRAVMHAAKIVDTKDASGIRSALHFTIIGDTVYVAGTDGARLNLGSFPSDSAGVPPGLLERIGGGYPLFQFKEKRKTSVILTGQVHAASLGWRKAIGMEPDEMSHPGRATCQAAGYRYVGEMGLSTDCLGNFMGELGRYCGKYLNHQYLEDVVGKARLTVQAFVAEDRLILLDKTHYPDRPLIHGIAFRHNMDLLTLDAEKPGAE